MGRRQTDKVALNSVKLCGNEVPSSALPRHVAIIMDGNGRWARERNLPRTKGHQEGINSVREITEASAELGLQQLTLYAFSVENWKRPKTEVDFLMGLLRRFLRRQRKTIMKNNIRFAAIGDVAGLPTAVQKELAATIKESERNTGLVLCLALNYGGRREIVEAARSLAKRAAEGDLRPEEITEEVFSQSLYTAGMNDPDLLIRTAGEQRVSNFLLWQISYAEFYFAPVCWPDFRRPQFEEALLNYTQRERRFGAVRDSTEKTVTSDQ
jgi:undecaprenyl diphosphate synthase